MRLEQKEIPYKMLTIPADTLTPIRIFQQLNGKKKFLLESSFTHEKKGKFSYIGVDPFQEIIGHQHTTTIIEHLTQQTKHINQHALTYLRNQFPMIEVDIPLPFFGGAIGYIGYDAIKHYVNVGHELPDELNMPDLHLMVYDQLIVYEHTRERVYLIALNMHDEDETTLDRKLEQMKKLLYQDITNSPIEPIKTTFTATMSKETFIEKVKTAKQHIHNGEVEQIVVSKRMQAPFTGDPLSYYRRLRMNNPSPYMFYIDFTDYLIIGTSPESLIQTTGDQVVTNPIGGTRHRGKTLEEDEMLMKELLADPKERSEHQMLVELSKHDLQKVCQQDSITVPMYMEIEKYQHVMHLVAEVHGTLKDGKNSIDALIAVLPAGTISGTPKIRAMELLNEIEETKRGFYSGGIGYLSFNHDLNFALAIRSLIIKDDVAYLQTGAGIVADSDPEKEYDETLHKARSLMEVNEMTD